MVLKGAAQSDVAQRLKIYDELRAQRVNKIIKYTREAAPKPTASKEINFQTTQAKSDYYWSYKITLDAVEAMGKHGYSVELIDAATGEIKLSPESSS